MSYTYNNVNIYSVICVHSYYTSYGKVHKHFTDVLVSPSACYNTLFKYKFQIFEII